MEDFEWNVFHEGQLLDAMVGHKPVGVNKYFQMAFICDKFIDNINKEVHSDKIWEHLETMYNLEALDESESLPFPNDEKEFYLPESEYGMLKAKKEEKTDDKKLQKGRETPKNMKEIKKDDKTPNRIIKEGQRRDSKDGKDLKPMVVKKEMKKEPEKSKPIKGRTLLQTPKEESKSLKHKNDDTPRTAKRPTRGSLKPEDSNSGGKSSPLTVTPTGTKRRRIN
ncbi:mrg-binding protein [Holotrichia oblita]|uniref:Mrg-binding protein n=1 Tax=Holotrichia oblita TaxID=644536 RepID=A0ACB9TQQ4_HOLOL|nr:mrg-binding protein [Holotrichia oblita]